MWLMKTLLTSGCTNQRGAGQDSWESINVPAYERWYDYHISKRGEGGLNEAEQEYISFIVKIANWNVSIHNLPEFDRERAFHDWFLTHDPNK